MPATKAFPAHDAPVPLTTHHLHREDRARLMRSTRKIEDVVGETPHVADPSILPLAQRRKLKRPNHKRTDTIADIVSPLPACETRPVLYLQVPDASTPNSATTTLPTPLPSPTLTVTLNLRYAVARDDVTRRRKMAKLRRTLGDNVPTELVFPPEDLNAPKYRRLTARTLPRLDRRASVANSQRSSGSGSGSRRASRLRDKDRERDEGESDISRGWVWVGKREDIPPEVQARIKRSRKESGLPFDWVSVGRIEELAVEDEEDRRMGAYPAMSNGGGGRRPLYRKEVGWSGEWDAGSARNMDQVVSRLRDLKVK
ncbi:hypothetical protein R3P38DRAFT_3275059 [Favolaschia claudopus]|uniref:Uncharacterized protein n=1 Tax=Favolaschia claudopus TaxID=2862362 RepID=A0AAW0AX76_9AGAR